VSEREAGVERPWLHADCWRRCESRYQSFVARCVQLWWAVCGDTAACTETVRAGWWFRRCSVVESTATLQDLKIQADASNISSSSKSNDDLRRKVNDLPVRIPLLPTRNSRGCISLTRIAVGGAKQPYLEMLDMDAVLSGASPLLSVRLVRAHTQPRRGDVYRDEKVANR
jgi:hypothetical protein